MDASPRPPEAARPAVLMLGKGWFPDQLGGMNRYFRALLEHQPEARGVVIGPAAGRPDRLVSASDHSAPLPLRLLAFRMAARRVAHEAKVVDAHFALYAIAALLTRPVRALPLVVHFQGPWADENVAQGDASAFREPIRRGLERAVYRRATRLVVLSSAFRRVVIERYRVSPWRVRVEPPGVDLGRFSIGDRNRARRALGLDVGGFVAVCVRRLVPRMGLDVLIDAWTRALPDLPPDARLLVAGEGLMRSELELLIAGRGLADSVRLLGRIDDDALVDLYRAADVGIVPTRSFEGFGLVVIEAAACGTPTIVTRIGGLPEAVAALDSSLVVPPGDAHALAARIVMATGAGGLPSRSATRSFAERHSWERVVERNRAICREALAPDAGARNIRVVYLDHVARLSGGELALLHLLPHLVGVEPHVVLAEDGPFADALVQAGISTEVMPMAERARGLRKGSVAPRALPAAAAFSTAGYVLRLALYLRRVRPDVVHTNSLKSGVYGSLAARIAGIPVVWHVRDRIAPDYLPHSAVWLLRTMTRRLAAVVIANSEATKSTLDPRADPVVLYSVVPEAASPLVRPEPHGASSITVGMIGRLAPWKGQDLFLRAFAEAFPNGDARCVLVGAALFGEDDFELRLRQLAADLGIQPRVEFRGFRSDVSAELDEMDMLVHASVIPEPFGQVILQGMAAGVPVVAADAGGPAEVISDGVNGVLYPMGDRAALATAMRQLADDPTRRHRLTDAGIASLADYRPHVVAERLAGLYQGAVSTKTATTKATDR